MSQENILISTSTFAEYDKKPLKLLEEKGLAYKLNPYGRKLTSQEFVHLIGKNIGVVAGVEDLNGQVLEQARALKVISRCGVGLDNVDLTKARQLGIKVFNTPDVVTWPVAELTVGLMLSLLRKISLMDREIRQGVWKKEMGQLLRGKRVGIIGLGRIGNAVAELLKNFGVEIVYFDNVVRTKNKFIKFLDLGVLLKTADIITLHISGGQTLLDEKALSLCKQGSFIINCARGGLIDERALHVHLKNGHLAGAALDVFEQEPYTGELGNLNNMILTSHIGSYARESRVEMEIQAVQNLIKGLKIK